MNHFISKYNNGEDPDLEPLNEFYSNWCKTHNGDMSVFGCHNVYLLKTIDRDGNVTKRAFALNVTTWNYFSYRFGASSVPNRGSFDHSYFKRIFIGSSSTPPTTSDTKLISPIITSSATEIASYPTTIEGSSIYWDSDLGLLKADAFLLRGYFNYVLPGISEKVYIREVGLSPNNNVNNIATRALVYDSEGQPSEIEKDTNEKLEISAYVTIYHKPGYIENNMWTNKGWMFAWNPWGFLAFGFSGTKGPSSYQDTDRYYLGICDLITHSYISSPRWTNKGYSDTNACYTDDINNTGASGICDSAQNIIEVMTLVDADNQILGKTFGFSGVNSLIENSRLYYDLAWIQLLNDYSTNEYTKHKYCTQGALVKPIYLPEPEEIETTWAQCESATSDSLTVNFGHAINSKLDVRGLLPVTNMQITSMKSYNGLTHEWDINESVINGSNTYNLTMYALYPFVGMYMTCPYYESEQIRVGRHFVRIYFNLFPEVPITSINTQFVSGTNIWCSDEYWNTDLETQNCWERIPDPSNIPPELGCKKYYIGFGGQITGKGGPYTQTQPVQITRAVAPVANGITYPSVGGWSSTVSLDLIDTPRDNGTSYYYKTNTCLMGTWISRRKHISNDDMGYIWMSHHLYYPELDVSWLITSSEYGSRPDPFYSLRFGNPSGTRILQFFRVTPYDNIPAIGISKVSIFEIPDASDVDPSDPTTYTPNEIVMTIEGMPSSVHYNTNAPYFMTPTETGYVVIVNPSTNRTHIINIDGDQDSDYAPYNYILKYPGTETEIETSKAWAIKYTNYVVYLDPNITTTEAHGFTIQDLSTDTIIDQFTISKSVINNVRWIAGWKSKLYIAGTTTSDINGTWKSYLYDLSRTAGSRLVDPIWSNYFSRSICPGAVNNIGSSNDFNWKNLTDPYTDGDDTCIIFTKTYKDNSENDTISIYYIDEDHADNPLDLNSNIGMTSKRFPYGTALYTRLISEICSFNKDNVTGEYKQKVLCITSPYYSSTYYTYFFDLNRIRDERVAPSRTHPNACPLTVSQSGPQNLSYGVRTTCQYKEKVVVSEYSTKYSDQNNCKWMYPANTHRFIDPNKLIPHKLSGTTRTIQAYNNPKLVYGIQSVSLQVANSEDKWDPSDLPQQP